MTADDFDAAFSIFYSKMFTTHDQLPNTYMPIIFTDRKIMNESLMIIQENCSSTDKRCHKFSFLVRLSKRSGSVWNCLWGRAL